MGQFCSPTNSVCVNNPGSFYCQCKDGFESIANGRACQGKIVMYYVVEYGDIIVLSRKGILYPFGDLGRTD